MIRFDSVLERMDWKFVPLFNKTFKQAIHFHFHNWHSDSFCHGLSIEDTLLESLLELRFSAWITNLSSLVVAKKPMNQCENSTIT